MRIEILAVGQPFGLTGEVVSPALLDALSENTVYPVPIVNPNAPPHAPCLGWATFVRVEGTHLVADAEFTETFAGALARCGQTRVPTLFTCSILFGRNTETGEQEPRVLDVYYRLEPAALKPRNS